MTDTPAAHRDHTTPDPALGRVLGQRYRLLAPLGAGGSAKVYLAHDQSLGRRVAVKCLRPGLTSDARFRQRFKAEAMAAARLTHPNLLAVYDWGAEPTPYLVTEVLLGGTLLDVMRRQRLSPSQGLLVALQVAKGLHYAHSLSTVHRDVKPANLLFGEDGRLRIADFGIARVVAEAAWTEPDGVLVGTARYAAPEQALGDSVDGRADVYSLALTVIEATTGRVPLLRENALGTMMLRQDRDIPVSGELGPLGDVLAIAGQADPAQRPDAGDLGEMLIAVARQLPRPEPLALAGPGPDVLDLRPDPDAAVARPSTPGFDTPPDVVAAPARSRTDDAPRARSRRTPRRRLLPDNRREPVDDGPAPVDAEADAALDPPTESEMDVGAETAIYSDSGLETESEFETGADTEMARMETSDLDEPEVQPEPVLNEVSVNVTDLSFGFDTGPSSGFLGASSTEAAWIWADDPTDPSLAVQTEPGGGAHDGRALNLDLDPANGRALDLELDLDRGLDLDLDLDRDLDLDEQGADVGLGIFDDDLAPNDDSVDDAASGLAIEEDLVLDPDHGLILDDDLGIVDGSTVDEGTDEDGAAEDGAAEDGTVDDGAVDDGPDIDGAVDDRAELSVFDEPARTDLPPSFLDAAPVAPASNSVPAAAVYAFDDDDDGPAPSVEEYPTRALRRQPPLQRERLSWETPADSPMAAMPSPTPTPTPTPTPMPAPAPAPAPAMVEPEYQPVMDGTGAIADVHHAVPAAVDRRRAWSRVNVPLLILVALAVIALLLVAVALLDRDQPTTEAGAGSQTASLGPTVPQMIGETRATAAAAAEVNGWQLVVAEQRRDGAEPGLIIAQDPIEGVALDAGSTLSITVATGPELRAIPLLTGLSVDEAEIALEEVGLRLGTVTSQPHESVPDGVVLGPVDGDIEAKVEPGSAVDLVVSLGPTEVALPSFVGLGKADALVQADQLGLRVRQTEAFNDTYDEGFVVDHTPPTGAMIGPGEEITLVLSLGPRLIAVPDVVGTTVEEATARMRDVGLVVAGTVGPPENPVRSSNPGAGTSVRAGAEIVLETES